MSTDVIPSSDGAGIVLTTGSSVTAYKAGDRVVTHLVPGIPDDQWPTLADIQNGLGQRHHGTLTQYGVFSQSGLSPMP
jgi:NADPH:quinone reductase-like Zn-dependent oxidoreductase